MTSAGRAAKWHLTSQSVSQQIDRFGADDPNRGTGQLFRRYQRFWASNLLRFSNFTLPTRTDRESRVSSAVEPGVPFSVHREGSLWNEVRFVVYPSFFCVTSDLSPNSLRHHIEVRFLSIRKGKSNPLMCVELLTQLSPTKSTFAFIGFSGCFSGTILRWLAR